jgi:hypothetical protein
MAKQTREQRQAANRNYDKARERLNSYKPKGGKEDAEYLRRNSAVIEAEKKVSIWKKLS